MKFFMEVIYASVADLCGYLVDLPFFVFEELLCVLDPAMIYVGVEALSDIFRKDLAKVGAAVPKEGSDDLEL